MASGTPDRRLGGNGIPHFIDGHPRESGGPAFRDPLQLYLLTTAHLFDR